MLSLIQRTFEYFQASSFYDVYAQTFDIIPADNMTRYYHAQSLYERHYGTDYVRGPNMLDFLLLHKPSSMYVGAARLTLPPRHYNDKSFEFTDNRHDIAEISRLIMSPRFLTRSDDGALLPAYYAPDWERPGSVTARRRIPYAPIGLLAGLFDAALAHNVTQCAWQVDTHQMSVLKDLGVRYRPNGRLISTELGESYPLLIDIVETLEHMEMHNPPCWDVLTGHGQMHDRADALS